MIELNIVLHPAFLRPGGAEQGLVCRRCPRVAVIWSSHLQRIFATGKVVLYTERFDNDATLTLYEMVAVWVMALTPCTILLFTR